MSDDPKDVVVEFAKVCSEAITSYKLYWHLFEMDEQRLTLYDTVAPRTFSDLNYILIQHVILEFAKLADPAQSLGKPNLTSQYVLEEIDWPDDVRSNLSSIHQRLMQFRTYILPARNKRGAHIDLRAQMDRLENIGCFPKGAERQFMRDLEEFVKVSYSHFHNDAPSLHVAMSDDVFQLVRALEESVVYKQCSLCDSGTRARAVLDYEDSTGLGPSLSTA
jgi:hypothetical protein